ncbi:MAG TPA: D-2-hydroxyacid dehydrogenase [Ramlibacter sp.]|nr:D-2-hydroxyacid dehydrogenase [Ramlibacter sp.]
MQQGDGSLRILLSQAAATKLSGEIAQVLGERPHTLVSPGDTDAALADIAFVTRDVTGLSTKHDVKPATQQFYDTLGAASRLQWIHIHSAGADRPIYVELRGRGVRVTTSSGANAPVVAQTAVLGLLSLARHWPLLHAAQRERQWASLMASGLPRDLGGQTAVVVGWGPVGQEIGRLLQAIGLKLVVARHSGQPVADDVPTVAYSRLREVLARADWLLLACPLSDATRELVGRDEFALLPSHAGLVNVARGDIVNEPAMIDALRDGRIAGAYLDVFAHEPLPLDSPLWSLPNVIVTPHSAGMSDANERHVARMFLTNLGRWVQGEP